MRLDYGSVEHIVATLEKDVKKEIEEEGRRVDLLVKEKRAQAKKEADEIEREVLSKGEERLEEEAKRIEDEEIAKMERKKREAKKELLEEAFEKLEKKLKRFTKTKTYGKLLRKLVKKSGIPSPLVRCRKEDEKHLKRRKTVGDLEGLGGVVAEDRKRTKRVDMTFESAIRRHEGELAAVVLEAIER